MAKRKHNHASPEAGANGHGMKQEVKRTKPVQCAHRNSPVFKAWSASRHSASPSEPLQPGSQRPFNLPNLFHAVQIVRICLWGIFVDLWKLHPIRTSLLILFNVLQGLFPAVRGYSRARILDEVQHLFATESLAFGHLGKLLLTDGVRMFAEKLIHVFSTHNEDIVQQSARFYVEYQQMAVRIRLDMPALCDPEVKDILAEADMFVRSFSGMGSFMLLSPLDMIRTFTTIAEIISQAYVLWSMSLSSARAFQSSQHWTEYMILALAAFPTICNFFNSRFFAFSAADRWSHSLEEAEGSRLEERHERMRNLAYSERYKREVLLFGMGEWILESWADAKRALAIRPTSIMDSTTTAAQTFAQSTSLEFFTLIQTIPLALQNSSASLGAVTMYRTTAELLLDRVSDFKNSLRLFYQGIFLLGAFHVALSLQPMLSPPQEDKTDYKSDHEDGMKIDINDLSFSYPGERSPTLHNVNFHVKPGEVVAIVGENGSGKSTFLNVLLRLYDFEDGSFRINDVDVRRYAAEDLHTHTSAVFQEFSQFNATLRENVGVGMIKDMDSELAVKEALHAGGGDKVLHALPQGLDSILDDGYGFTFGGGFERRALSGGEWQRVAISRAFMRPNADLYVFDEANSALDANAQNELFHRITNGCVTTANGKTRKRTVVYVTHRLSTVRRADKVAMFEKGTITEFGTHAELMARPQSSYKKLYQDWMADPPDWALIETTRSGSPHSL